MKTIANLKKPETFYGSGIYKSYVALNSILGFAELINPSNVGWGRYHEYSIKYAIWHQGSPDL